MGLFEGLTVPAKQVLIRATEAARVMGSDEVEGAHLLVGFIDAETAVQALICSYLPNRAVVAAATKAFVPPGRENDCGQFSHETCLVLAMARGIAVGRQAPTVGSATLLLALLTHLPRSVEDVLHRCQVDVDALRSAVSDIDDSGERTGPPPGGGGEWTITVGGESPFSWTDERP